MLSPYVYIYIERDGEYGVYTIKHGAICCNVKKAKCHLEINDSLILKKNEDVQNRDLRKKA